MIQLKGLIKEYGRFRAVDGLDLDVAAGQVYGFLGPNGAGKTTTIRMITGLLRPSAGQVLVHGIDMGFEPEKAKTNLGFVPDRPELFSYLSVIETLRLVGGLRGLSDQLIETRGAEWLRTFDLEAWRDERVGQLSHGMRQKLSLACALLHQPSVLVLDEPMVGLDPKGSRQVKDLLRGLAAEGRTVFLSIHTLEIAEVLCDRLGILLGGRLVAEGTVAQIRERAGLSGGDLESVFLRLTGGERHPQGA